MQKMITGRGQLQIAGSAMDISFTVPEGPCRPEALLPEAQRLANQLAERAVARVEQAGHQISCAKGCGACCRQMVPVSPVEAHHLAALVDKMPAAQAAKVRDRFKAARQAMAEAALGPRGHPDEDKTAYRAHGLAYFRVGVACPFLEEESCSIHPDRPLVCREYLVTSPPPACAVLGSGMVRQVVIPLRMWAVFGRSTSADRRLQWMPLIDSLDYAEHSPEPAADRTGPQRVEALLRELKS